MTPMSGTPIAKRKYDYKPLGAAEEAQREKIISGALTMLAEDETLIDVAAHFRLSKSTLLAALNYYAEDQWKELQIARAQVSVQRASQKRMEIAAQLDGYQAKETAGEKTTETGMTYPRIREQLRIAEHEERSAQWHLERLHKRLYGSSVAMTIEEKPFEMDPDLLKTMQELLDKHFDKAKAAGTLRPIDGQSDVVSVEIAPQPAGKADT